MNIDNKMYRVSAKALVEERGKYLVVLEKKGVWELPGGGIEHGENAQETIKREVKEECGFDVAAVADAPQYMWTVFREKNNIWTMMLAYPTTLASMEFTPSEECVEFRFVTIEEIRELPLHENIKKLPEILS